MSIRRFHWITAATALVALLGAAVGVAAPTTALPATAMTEAMPACIQGEPA